MSDYKFTQDWFHWAPELWTQLIPMLPGTAGDRRFLEIGSFEGRSAVWIAENMAAPEDTILCVDTWKGGEEHGAEDMEAVFELFKHNIIVARKKTKCFIGHCRRTSTSLLAEEIAEDQGATYDFVYIDGSHVAKDVLTDACLAWPLLKQGGLMVFDDYMWGEARDILHRPKVAIDAFVNIFAEEIELVHAGYQLVVRKKETP